MKAQKPLAKPEDFDGLTLMRMRTENVHRVRLIDISLDRTMTVIGAANKQGKTSFFKSYEYCIGGKARFDRDPLHGDEAEGTITLDFGDGETVQLRAKRTIQRVGNDDVTTDLELIIPGYITPSKQQDFLDKLAGALGFDPMAFDAMDDEQQFETLRTFVGDFDFDANKVESDRLFKQRTEVGRDKKREQSAADAIDILDKAPGDREDETALTAELKAVGDHNVDIERRTANRTAATKRIETLVEQVAEKRREAKRLMDESDALVKEADELQAKLDAADPLPPTKDAAEIEAKLNAARKRNRAIDDWEAQRARKKNHQTAADGHAKEYEELTAKIAELDHDRAVAIQQAHMPVDGLGFGDGYITLGGVSWKEASEAERIDAAVAIQMALNPKLRAILIRHASGVGSQIREQIRERAAKAGYRVLMEVLDESGANSHVYLEDGMVKLIDGKEPPAPPPEPAVETVAVTDDGPNKLTDEFALSSEPPAKKGGGRARKAWQGPGAPTGEQ